MMGEWYSFHLCPDGFTEKEVFGYMFAALNQI